MRIGIDLGGTKIEGVVLADDGAVLARQRISTPGNHYLNILDAVSGLVTDLENQVATTCSVGIGTPGAASTVTGLMKNCNTTCLNGRPLAEDLSLKLGRRVRIANDANCFALSEAVDGSGANAEVVFGVIIGTGVGGGIVINRQILRGHNAIGGEWGHNLFPGQSEGRPCYCGRQDCVETWLSGAGLAASYRAQGGKADNGKAVADKLAGGDLLAKRVIKDYCRQLARALSVVCNILDPGVIVLGGGLSQLPDLAPRTTEALRQMVFSDACNTEVRIAKYGDASGVRGAAWLWE
ncbi:ROK family protein [Spongiibacter nanhainus]|uniref:ROK family protein n=1 Tax=Spongiibacter nanhainus TaxID=2794344 RepID=A0A7T4US58_9GAMM|nr:ROK family protein [Spongiibacter nanhainus]QQD19100.1 ROK family protein [Spongiibacter nanhainus]